MRRALTLLIVTFIFCGMLCACDSAETKFLKEVDSEMFVLPQYSIEEIWQLEERSEFINAMWVYVNELCDYGEKVDVLNHEQRIFYVAALLEMEVNNGGFAQFFFNSSGARSAEIVGAFEEIGASQTAEICQKAIDVFDCEIPGNWEERLEAYTNLMDDEMGTVLMECDDAFYSTEGDLEDLFYRYIVDHRWSFS